MSSSIQRRLRHAVLVAAGAAVASGCGERIEEVQPLAPETRLIVLLVADQLGYGYVEAVRQHLDGGLGLLLDEGASFTSAHHRHARPDTAPGHATLASGAYPRRSGIIANYWWDHQSRELVRSVEDDRYGDSPRTLRVGTLGDWLKRRDRSSRVFAASAKPRSAVLLGGHSADAAFWYDREEGRFTSSGYYPRRQPRWLEDFHATRSAEELFFGRSWTPLEASLATWPGALSDAPPVYRQGFPYAPGGPSLSPDEAFFYGIYETPFMDEYLLELVATLVREEGLGQGRSVDLLGVSFSALDSVGHEHGPHSLEAWDTVLRLDALIGELLALLDEVVGHRRVVVAFSADHGVMPLPEELRAAGVDAAASRHGVEQIDCFQNAGRRLAARYPLSAVGWDRILLDEAALADEGVSLSEVMSEAERQLEACPGVEAVWTADELATPPADGDLAHQLFYNGSHPGRSPHLQVQWTSSHLPLFGWKTTHTTPYGFNTHVPLVLWGGDIRPGTIDEPVATVDLAPTLAHLVGIVPPGEIDGVDRSALLSLAGGEAGQ